MLAQQTATAPAAQPIELTLRDHPGTLPQVCGLLMRRGFRYQALSYHASAGEGRLQLTLEPGQREEQLLKFLGGLYDVLQVRRGG